MSDENAKFKAIFIREKERLTAKLQRQEKNVLVTKTDLQNIQELIARGP